MKLARMPTYIWNQLRFPDRLPLVLALATIIISISFVVVFVSLWIARLGIAEKSGDTP
ncbi:MAG: hypothetical protein AAGI70_09815 [Pseudomonadota bacterium]